MSNERFGIFYQEPLGKKRDYKKEYREKGLKKDFNLSDFAESDSQYGPEYNPQSNKFINNTFVKPTNSDSKLFRK